MTTQTKQTAPKAVGGALSCVVLAAISMTTGLVDMPPLTEVAGAITLVVYVVVPAAVGFVITYFSPRNKDKT